MGKLDELIRMAGKIANDGNSLARNEWVATLEE